MKNIILLSMLALLFSCAEKTKNKSTKKYLLQGVKKEKAQANKLTNQGHNLSLKKEALDNQLFLMGVAYIGGAPAPTGYAMANKLVYFKRNGNSLYLFESLEGKRDTDDVKTALLLAKFPIIHDQENNLVFDFDNGMKYLFEKRSTFISSSNSDDEGSDTAIDIKESFLNKVEQRNESLYIEQFARMYSAPTPKSKGENFSLHLKYSFKPYVKNKSFTPRESIGFNNVGYFENYPVHEAGTGNKATYIARFDHNKTILFYLSQNIPAKHVQAVKDGVLYWNKAFGKEVIKVKILPKNLDVHEPGINLIKWLSWDTAGFAYANTSVDPLTGEALQATVYMTSSFGKGGLKRAKYYLQRLHDETSRPKVKVSLKGFHENALCERSHSDEKARLTSLIDTISNIDSLNISDVEKEKIYLRYSNDYIRETVAHEVGHNLGLRHNFAASTQTTITAKEFDKVAAHYLVTGEVLNNKLPATSVMDYTPSFFAAMSGASIRTSSKALPYDQKAIDFGYHGKDIYELIDTPFCTDHEASGSVFVDCLRFDRFANPFEESNYEYTRALKTISYRLIGQLISKDGDDVRVKSYSSFDALKDSSSIINYAIKPLLNRLSKKARFVQLDRSFNSYGTLGSIDYLNKTVSFQKESASKFGGINFILDTLNPVDGKLPLSHFIKERTLFIIKNKYGQLSESDEQKLESEIDQYTNFIEKEYLLQAVQYFSNTKLNITEDNFIPKLVEAGKKLILETEQENNSRLFEYRVRGKDLRLEVAKMLKQNYYPNNPYFHLKKKDSLKTIIDKLMNEIETLESSDSASNEALFNYIKREKKVLSKIKS